MYTATRANLLVLIHLISLLASAQSMEFRRVPETEQALLQGVKSRYEKDLTGLNGPNKKFTSGIYQQRFELISKKLESHQVLTDPQANTYLNQMVSEILKANPQLSAQDLRIVFSRDWWPNASSMGEGTILFNIGLFHRLQNESQAAFVLCHELAHYYLDHGNQSISRYVDFLFSAETQKKLKDIQRSEYRQNTQAELLAEQMSFTSRRHSRAFEKAADSMALVFLAPTRFDAREALSCLGLLDSLDDHDKYVQQVAPEIRFNFPAYPFRKSWLQSSALRFAETKEDPAKEDSLKTHPDCAQRIEVLRYSVKNIDPTGKSKFLQTESVFKNLQQSFDYEVLNSCFENGSVSRCLYLALEMYDHSGPDPRLLSIIGKCFNELYTKQKLHELGKIVDLPGPQHDKDYNTLLQMIQNMRLSEMASVCYYFLFPHSQTYATDPAFASVWKTTVSNFNQQ